MIITLGTTVLLVIGIFAIVVSTYASRKALRISERYEKATIEERYLLEKDFALLSSVSWIILPARIAMIPLFFWTMQDLIPAIPGAMCGYGVMQAAAPYSWMNLGIKLFTLYAYSGWLVLDWINRRCKGSPLTKALSSKFLLLTPVLYADSFLDLAFFWELEPITVPCCRIAFPAGLGGIYLGVTCPCCLVFFILPLLAAAIPLYALSVACLYWVWLIGRYGRLYGEVGEVGSGARRKLLNANLAFAMLGTLVLIVQALIGPAPRPA